MVSRGGGGVAKSLSGPVTKKRRVIFRFLSCLIASVPLSTQFALFLICQKGLANPSPPLVPPPLVRQIINWVANDF